MYTLHPQPWHTTFESSPPCHSVCEMAFVHPATGVWPARGAALTYPGFPPTTFGPHPPAPAFGAFGPSTYGPPVMPFTLGGMAPMTFSSAGSSNEADWGGRASAHNVNIARFKFGAKDFVEESDGHQWLAGELAFIGRESERYGLESQDVCRGRSLSHLNAELFFDAIKPVEQRQYHQQDGGRYSCKEIIDEWSFDGTVASVLGGDDDDRARSQYYTSSVTFKGRAETRNYWGRTVNGANLWLALVLCNIIPRERNTAIIDTEERDHVELKKIFTRASLNEDDVEERMRVGMGFAPVDEYDRFRAAGAGGAGGAVKVWQYLPFVTIRPSLPQELLRGANWEGYPILVGTSQHSWVPVGVSDRGSYSRPRVVCPYRVSGVTAEDTTHKAKLDYMQDLVPISVYVVK